MRDVAMKSTVPPVINDDVQAVLCRECPAGENQTLTTGLIDLFSGTTFCTTEFPADIWKLIIPGFQRTPVAVQPRATALQPI